MTDSVLLTAIAKLETAHSQNMKEIDRLNAELAAEREKSFTLFGDVQLLKRELTEASAELAAERERKSAPPYVFRRFRGGNEMAEGVVIENAETLEHAIAKAARFYPGTGTVFVIEDVAVRKERDELRAELAAERDTLRAELAAANTKYETALGDHLTAKTRWNNERARAAKLDADNDALRAELAAAREALKQILAIELDKYGSDWCEIEQAQDIARAALGGGDE